MSASSFPFFLREAPIRHANACNTRSRPAGLAPLLVPGPLYGKASIARIVFLASVVRHFLQSWSQAYVGHGQWWWGGAYGDVLKWLEWDLRSYVRRVWSRWTVNFRSCVLCCVVHCGEVDRFVERKSKWASRCRRSENRSTSRGQAKNFRICLMTTKVVSSTKPQARSVKVQSLTLLTLSCQGITKTTTRSGSAVSPKKKKKVESNKRSGAERIWTDDHPGLQSQPSIPPRLYRNRRLRGEKKSMESWSPPGSARFSVRKKCVVCFWQNLTKSKFSLFRLSNNLCCHWCWSLCSRTYPNPSKNTKSDPKSLTRIALHRISCGSACLTQVRPSPFWGAPRTVVKPRASSPFFL